MTIFLQFVKKEFIHLFRDARSLCLVLGMPILLVITFGFALSNELKDVKLNIAIYQTDPLIEDLVQKIDASGMIDVMRISQPSVDMDEEIRQGKAQAILVFPQGMERAILNQAPCDIQLRIDASDPNSVAAISAEVQGILYDYLHTRFYSQTPPDRTPYTLSTHNVLMYNPEMKASFYFVPGVMGMVLMIVCAMMTSISIVREKEYGSMEVLLTTPVNPLTILISKSIPYWVISMCNVLSILGVAHFVLKVPILGSLTLIFLVSLLFILVSLLLGLLISTLTNNQMVAMLISGAGLLLPVAMLSGMLFPTESMPQWLEYISHIVPAKWYVLSMKKLMIQGASWQDVYPEIIILSSMAIALVAIGLYNFKTKLD